MNKSFFVGIFFIGIILINKKAIKKKSSVESARKTILKPRMNAIDIVRLQLKDLITGSTMMAYKLASPENRRNTAKSSTGDNHDFIKFDKMVRTSFSPMLTADDYAMYTEQDGTVDVVLYENENFTVGYRFELSKIMESDNDESLTPFELPFESGYWRTDSVTLLPTKDVKKLVQSIKKARQLKLRERCFGRRSRSAPSIQHSFGEDMTHNLCCALGPDARLYADATNNPIGHASEKISEKNPDNTTRWPTCMGSNVCGKYADMHNDGTRALFATNIDLTRIATRIPRNANCEALVAKMLHVPSHNTPGIRTRGIPEECSTSNDISILKKQYEIDEWLE